MKTMDVFEKRLMPLAEMIGKNKIPLTMRDSFAMN